MDKSQFKIIDATSDDAVGIRAVQKITWLATYPNEALGITRGEIEKRFDDSSPAAQKRMEERKEAMNKDPNMHTWVAKDGDQIIGFCSSKIEEQNGRIQALYLLPEYQGKGLGGRLMQTGLDWVEEDKDVIVDVASYNDHAIAFYKSFGFVESGKPVAVPVTPLLSGASIPETELIKKAKEHVSPKQISTEKIEAFVQDQFGLKTVGDSEVISQGVESAVWLLTTNDGKWYAKVYGQHEGPLERIQEETELYDYLREHGINVPEVRATLEGQKVVQIKTKDGKYSTILMRHEEIREPKPTTITQDELENIARTVAKMHNVLKDYPNRDKLIEKDHIPTQLPVDALQLLMDSPNKNVFTANEIQRLKELDVKMVDYLKNNPVPTNLSETVLHGDLTFGHAQLLPNGEVYFFDFADRWYGPIAHELGILTENLYRPEDITYERFEQLRDWLLTTYAAEVKLTPEDYKAMTPFILRHTMEAVRYLSSIAQKAGYEVDSKGIKRRYKLAEYLLI